MSKLPYLHVTHAREPLRLIEITSSFFLIGRTSDCDLRLNAHKVSRHHAHITNEGGRLFLTDLASTNGTRLNHQPLPPDKPQRLQDGDLIQIADFQIKFVDETHLSDTSQIPTDTITAFGRSAAQRLRLDEAAHEVYFRNKQLDPPPSPQEFALLALLFVHEGSLVSYKQIHHALWPHDPENDPTVPFPDLRRIQQAVKHLRQRLAQIDKEWDYIKTIRGVGLMFVQRKSN